MTPEEKSLLERTYKMVEENNSILHGIRRSGRYAMAMRIGYWVLILLLSLGAYYFIQPYLTTILGLYNQTQGGINSIQDGVNTAQNAANSLRDLLK